MFAYSATMFLVGYIRSHGMFAVAMYIMCTVAGVFVGTALLSSRARLAAGLASLGDQQREVLAGSAPRAAADLGSNQDTKFVSRGERECRRVAEQFFGKPFVSVRPEFLVNPVTGRALEIDCYNDELKIGIEYNGRQHYNYIKTMHPNYEAFLNLRYRDYIKELLCRVNGVALVKVPYTQEHNIETYLTDKLAVLHPQLTCAAAPPPAEASLTTDVALAVERSSV